MRLKSDEILVLCGQCDDIAEDRQRSIERKFRTLGITNTKGELTDRGEHIAATFELNRPKSKPKPKQSKPKLPKPKSKPEREKKDGATNGPQEPDVEG